MAPADDTAALTRLIGGYASAVDGRDLDALRGLFLPDATLTVSRAGAEPEVHHGHAGLAGVIEAVAAAETTLHESSSLLLEMEPGGEEASGECACVAHHLRRAEGREATDFILYGRYLDRFRRGEDGGWRFASRELCVLWSEKRSVRLG